MYCPMCLICTGFAKNLFYGSRNSELTFQCSSTLLGDSRTGLLSMSQAVIDLIRTPYLILYDLRLQNINIYLSIYINIL